MAGVSMELAVQLRDALSAREQRLVLVESCTAGKTAATLGGIPGISEVLCGGFVVYRNRSKSDWLGIPPELLEDPAVGPVSRQVSELLAVAALERTVEADLALAITGDLGPGASPDLDGNVFIGMVQRQPRLTENRSHHLVNPPPSDREDLLGRLKRLDEATNLALAAAVEFLTVSGKR